MLFINLNTIRKTHLPPQGYKQHEYHLLQYRNIFTSKRYNLHTKKKNWIQNLALEAETAITQVPTNEREVYRKLVADLIEKLQQQHNSHPTHSTQPEAKLISQSKPNYNKTMP
jgi:hypothetical protein